jgi:site-specific DNA recombinase
VTKCVIYARFSPKPRAEDSESIELQLEACRKYCNDKGYEIAGEFSDRAISGKEEDRPGLWDALDALGPGYVLVAHKHDRLARDVYVSEIIRRAARKRRAKVEVVADIGNGDSPGDELIGQVLQAFAQYERRIIAARTKAAKLRIQASGIAISVHPPYGKQFGPEENIKGRIFRTLVDDPEEILIAERIRMLRFERRYGLSEIARRLNMDAVPSRGTKWRAGAIKRICERSEG